MRSTIGFCAMTLAAAGLLLTPAVNAQTQAPSAPSTTKPDRPAPAADISEKKLDDTAKAVKLLGVADRPIDATDMAFVGLFVVIGALIGSLVFKVSGVPLTLSTAGGALIAGIIGGWLRSVRPSFGRIRQEVKAMGKDVFICLDLSESMNCFDVQPSRLLKVKFELRNMLRELLQ